MTRNVAMLMVTETVCSSSAAGPAMTNQATVTYGSLALEGLRLSPSTMLLLISKLPFTSYL